MAFSDSGAVLRADLRTLVEEAARADEMFIGLKVLPETPSDNKTGQYPKFRLAKGELLNDDAQVRQPGAGYNRIIRAYENDNLLCLDRGLEEVVDDTYKEDVARYFAAEVKAAQFIRRQVQIGHEVRVATAMQDTAVWNHTAAAVAYTEANLATIKVIKDITDAIGRCNDKGVIPNTIIMSKNVWLRTRRTADVISYIRGSKSTDAAVLANASQFASIFVDDGIKQCLVGKFPKNTAKKGQAYVAGSIWSDLEVWVGYVESGDPMSGGAGRTFFWNKEGGFLVPETYRSEERRSDIVRVRQNTVEKIIDATAGELIDTSYA